MRPTDICKHCFERPDGCWKAQPFDCVLQYAKARDRARACPIGKWGQWIYLPDVPTIVYTCDKAHCVARHPRVRQILGDRKFSNWQFLFGASEYPYWIPIRRDWIEQLRQREPPLLWLEDDIGVRDFHPWIQYPDGYDVIYLGGGGAWRNSGLVSAARSHLPGLEIRQVGAIGVADIDDQWVRPFGMFGVHAVLFLEKRSMLEIAQAIEEGWAVGKREIDVIIGANQWRWNCALIRTPMFYQADGHNDAGTWDYAKDPIVEPQETRVDRIRAERHQLAGVS